jgi:nickel transport protein
MRIRLILLLFFILLPLQAQGHKINVFAWVSGDMVTVESSFSGNRPLKKSSITVNNNQTGDQILQGEGDEKGIFSFTIPPALMQKGADLRIIVSAGDGHQAEWLLPATEYVSNTIIHQQPQKQIADSEELRRLLQEVLEQELAPIRRSIAKANDSTPGFHDIMGGIGYLLGLAGLVSWLRNRKPASRPKE